MCGIALSVDTHGRGRARPWALEQMRHRGPDGEGVLAPEGRRLTLEHCRLAIIDPDNREADQPFADPSGRWQIMFNGEIFNFASLRAELQERGVAFRTRSDTEVLLHGFLQEGEKFLQRVRGMFAFVVCDTETGELFAARDHMGVKPFYYTLTDGLFVAGSELRTVLAHPAVRAELDPVAVVRFLAFGGVGGARTLVEGVRTLPPGHALRLREGRLDVSEYWDVLPSEGGHVSDAAAPAELLELLDESVRLALVADVPVGVMLSGGLDSSAIAGLAARAVRPQDLTAYSVAFGLPDDESTAAARLAGDLGLRHRVVRLGREDLEEGFDAWLDGIDEPSANPTWVAVSFIARAARGDGIKVLLSGDGGDELFGGYRRWMSYLRFHDRVWRLTPRGARRAGGALARPFARGLAGDVARRASAGGELFVPSRPFHDDDLDAVLGGRGRQAARDVPPESYVEELRERFEARAPTDDYLAWMSYAALKTFLVDDYLARLDKMGMRESVEGRVPLLDPELARWSFRVPQRVKVAGYRQKALFRSAVSRLLPGYILDRPKQGFCPPVAAWASAVLRRRDLDPSPLSDVGLVQPEAARTVLRETSRDGFPAWTLGTLLAWCHRNL